MGFNLIGDIGGVVGVKLDPNKILNTLGSATEKTANRVSDVAYTTAMVPAQIAGGITGILNGIGNSSWIIMPMIALGAIYLLKS